MTAGAAGRPTPGMIATAACLIEAAAPKAGNVHPGASFDDLGFLDLALAAAAIGPAIDSTAGAGLGASILAAVVASSRVSASNANLGMVLLLAPLARVDDGEPTRAGVARVLGGAGVDDARLTYRAIRAARAGGLGASAEQDVGSEPTTSLVGAMRIAADRDDVARQYATDYADVFGLAAPALADGLRAGLDVESAVVRAHLVVMAGRPDTLIARKRGRAVAAESSRRALSVVEAGWPSGPGSAGRFRELDAWLRADGHARNPGTSADLVAAALYAAIRDGLLTLPIRRTPPGAPS